MNYQLCTGQAPFPNMDNFQVIRQVAMNQRPNRPAFRNKDDIPDKLWDLIQRCWAHFATERPSVHVVAEELRQLIATLHVAPSVASTNVAPHESTKHTDSSPSTSPLVYSMVPPYGQFELSNKPISSYYVWVVSTQPFISDYSSH